MHVPNEVTKSLSHKGFLIRENLLPNEVFDRHREAVVKNGVFAFHSNDPKV
ncbi:hypothetical protein ATL17_2494 [Maritalea mobilis]|uniref:Phytanoyl-CoA dioxygenase PhyH n=1 Tax=Maritalea mobilis TaxID=483324 RepID=A0A4R6VLT2_9HYPH|nr:hypothetical protein ATL17_2494 [Maritalea mobilis]